MTTTDKATMNDEIAALKNRIRKLQDALKAADVDLEKTPLWRPLGHFYSPIHNLSDLKPDEDRIFERNRRTLPGIKLNEDKQKNVMQSFVETYDDLPFSDEPSDQTRYGYKNGGYSYSDAICLYSMIRRLKPKKIIEVGSGYSSCCMLDTNELFFNNNIDMNFIEPYPKLLKSLMRKDDLQRWPIHEKRLQDMPADLFKTLGENDILFVDSTHVSRAGSDVNHLFFEILPILNQGVHVHFHDIHYPFEYPKHWVYEGRGWTENYILRAFLEFNSDFEIVFSNTFMQSFHRQFFEDNLSLCLKNPGASIWLRRRSVSSEENV